MVDLGRHTTAYAAKGHISNAIDDADTGPLSIPIEANANAAENYGKAHQTVGTADETDIVPVETEAVFVADQHGVGAGSKAWAYARLQTHARDRAGAITTLSRLQATATTKVPLTTFIVAPSRSGLNVIQCLLPQVSLCTRKANHTGDPTRTGLEWRLAHRDGKLVAVASVWAKCCPILAWYGTSVRTKDRMPGENVILPARKSDQVVERIIVATQYIVWCRHSIYI